VAVILALVTSLARAGSRGVVVLVAVGAGVALLAAVAMTRMASSTRHSLEHLRGEHERLEQERARLAATIETLGEGVIVTEPGSTTIASVNRRARELIPELVVGDGVDAPQSPLPPLNSALGHETTVEHNGRTLTVSAAEVGDGGGVVWTLHDITDRARLERAKSEFVATASHELRSPLTSIKGFVELLERDPQNLSARQREFVQIILKSSERLVDLVGDLLDVARIEADQVELDPRPMDVGEAVREVTEMMEPRFAEKDQRLEVHVAPTVPLALADPARVRQIVANLLTNAHLYTDTGGSVQVNVDRDRAWVQIVVEDDGVGMTPEESAHIFEPFYRGRDGSRSSAGTGLGLSIVNSLVDLHHGRIDVESEAGQGTAFRVLLPAVVPAPEPDSLLPTLRGCRVLIVDDERQIAQLIEDQLAPLLVQTAIASSGEEALEQLRSQQFDAVTLDILMPGMDGFEVLRKIRADEKLREIPIVFVSVFSGRQELAGEWVVSKPIDADELRAVLGAAVRAGRSSALVVARPELRDALAPALEELGIEHRWESTGPAAARVCLERRFEVALVDVGVRNPGAVLQALDLRGRRTRRAVILFSDGVTPTPPGVDKLGIEVVPFDQAAPALLAALRRERGE
jgi:signal transduction histidine kinase/DNA-binding response OmpR family regulator